MGTLKRSGHTLVSNHKCAFKHDVVPGWNDVVPGWNDVVPGWNDVVPGWNEQVKELHSAARDAYWLRK